MDDTVAGHQVILILDFGSQYSHLIARRIREANVYCQLVSYDTTAENILSSYPKHLLKGIILSGGPASVYDEDAPHMDPQILSLLGPTVPILGICYGFQELMWQIEGGKVVKGERREYGNATMKVIDDSQQAKDLCGAIGDTIDVWMSHNDKVIQMPPSWSTLATTLNAEFAAAVGGQHKNWFGLQFHPEVTHTSAGALILTNFAKKVCACQGDWTMAEFIKESTTHIQNTVGDTGIVIGAVSGGVDSTVAAVLMNKAIGNRFHGILVDNGVLRKNEASEVLDRLKNRCGVDIDFVDASNDFLFKLNGVHEPEAKRKIIGAAFIDVFEAEANKFDAKFLLQGTLYPDVIESLSHKGPSATIKSHHNVGGLPARMNLKLIEPLRFLFKDEVRALGLLMGIERESIMRHPFPGPGLAIRCLGDLTPTRLDTLREADAIYIEELRKNDLYDQISQAFVVLLPVKAVGVMGDQRTYQEVVALRAVKTTDFMTADWFDFPPKVLRHIATRIVNEVHGINRVTYDVTTKPPGTIEWE